MKRFLLLICTAVITLTVSAQGGLFNKAKEAVNKVKGGSGSSLSTEEIVAGLREALTVGATNSSGKLSAADGFFKDAAVKILLPEEVQKVEKKMRMLGMGKIVDNTILSMNRAAEDASKSAADIFIKAIKNMSISDALGILRGQDTAATSYLRIATNADLTAAFRPVIESSLAKVDATKYWKDFFTAYNRISSEPVNTDLNAYVTERAMKGIFHYVAEEEKKIRKDPAARVNDILKKVFAN
ncbi:MAG TPA: DUF4197 domain-containing protein [Chitinophagaceae bacterium]|nr:DUF4197 domain-containing protein [Chitinophagaceae bacterium]